MATNSVAPISNASESAPPACLSTHASVLFPLPEGNYAHVLVRDNLNAPNFMIGDVLLANLDVTSAKWDGIYVVQIGDQQLVRWIHFKPDPKASNRMAYYVFCMSMPDSGFFVGKKQIVVLAHVESHAQIRRVS
ncbi:hypothetical protein [Xanthomonas arboricola]|uniref:hypothetical protein n=1 Tax=Xanthomonas arboricola TaxID=56448 RepID=UPI003EBD17A1